jgi:hypothetical protein
MARASLCHICKKVSRNTCSMCGRPVCEEHYDKLTGLCYTCKAGKRGMGLM